MLTDSGIGISFSDLNPDVHLFEWMRSVRALFCFVGLEWQTGIERQERGERMKGEEGNGNVPKKRSRMCFACQRLRECGRINDKLAIAKESELGRI